MESGEREGFSSRWGKLFRLPRVHPSILIAVAVVRVLPVAAAFLPVGEPGLLHVIRAAWPGPQQMAPVCGGVPMPC